MLNAFSKWCRDKLAGEAPGKMDRHFVSDFTHFIDHFVEEHPEVAAEQRSGRLIYWDKIVDRAAQAKAAEDTVPDDGYGFHASAFEQHAKKH